MGLNIGGTIFNTLQKIAFLQFYVENPSINYSIKHVSNTNCIECKLTFRFLRKFQHINHLEEIQDSLQ